MKKKYMKPTMDVEELSLSHFLLASNKMKVKIGDKEISDIYYGGVDEDGEEDPD